MSNWYLIGDGASKFADREFVVVEAETADRALEQYIDRVGIRDQDFLDHVYDRSVGSGFAKSFYLMTPEDNERYWTTGKAPVEGTELAQRVTNFFGAYHEFADIYTEFLSTDKDRQFPDDMLFYIYWQLHSRGQWMQIEIIPMDDMLL